MGFFGDIFEGAKKTVSNPVRALVNPWGLAGEFVGQTASAITGSNVPGDLMNPLGTMIDKAAEKPKVLADGSIYKPTLPPSDKTKEVQEAGDAAVREIPRGRLATMMSGSRGLDTQPYTTARRTLMGR